MSARTNLPSFFILGAARAGTTALFDLFRRRPDTFVPTMKEPNYFAVSRSSVASEALRSRSVGTLEEYSDLYRNAMGPAGDVSPEYLRSATAAEAIAELVPTARLVAVLRNPVDRSWSDYCFHVRNGTETSSFPAALADQARRRWLADDRTAHYLDTGRYSTQIERYLDAFDRSQFLVVLYDDLVRDPDSTVRKIVGHIGADDDPRLPHRLSTWNPSGVGSNRAAVAALRARQVMRPYLHRSIAAVGRPGWERLIRGRVTARPLESADREWLRDYYEQEVSDLSNLLDMDLSARWLSRPEGSA